MDSETRQRAIDLYDRFTHEGMDRRVFMARMATIAGSVAAAEALVASIAASPAAAAVVPADDARL
ncbi:MAG TPA: dienelactone hydrolase family protein, partial [Sphingomicrobium sp.]|nr:dienelactone hydrolase family protein [Sphingomicrobium sp.]